MCFFSLLAEIPDVIWSGVIASVLTLSGVLISNGSNTNRLKLQLQHDSNEKEKERKAALRRDVYLLAAEECVKANTHLSSLPQIDLTAANPADGLKDFFAVAAKLQLISNQKTSFLVSELVATYGELFFMALAKLKPIQSLRTEVSIRDKHYTLAQAEVTRVLAKMAQFNESAQTDIAVFNALNHSFEFHQSQAKQFTEERKKLSQEQSSLHIAFIREWIPNMKLIGERQLLVMIELRRELHIESDIDAFTQLMNAQWQKINSQMDTLLTTLEN